MTNPSINWSDSFPATDGPGINGYFAQDWSGELMVQMTIIVPDDGQEYGFRWWQQYGGSRYEKLLSPGQNDLSFTLDNASSDFDLIRALVFRGSGTSGVNVTIPEAPVLSVPSGLVASDDEATTSANTPVTVDVLANDTFNDEPVALEQLEGPPTIHEQPANGTVSVAPDGKITYTPNPGFDGEDEFVYRIAKPKPEVCIKGYVEYYYVGIVIEEDIPSWFQMDEGFDLSWDGGENWFYWDESALLHRPADGPTLPENCESGFPATLTQGGNSVEACIDTLCPS